MIRRINLFGGVCSGKSTVASYVFSELKKLDYNIELVNEYVKFWTYVDKKVKGYDQYYINAKQVYKEDNILRSMDLIITDSPLYLYYIYSKYLNASTAIQESAFNIAKEFDEKYPAINVIVENNNKYNPKGRFQNKKEAKELNSFIKKEINNSNLNYQIFNCEKTKNILSYVITTLWKNNKKQQ